MEARDPLAFPHDDWSDLPKDAFVSGKSATIEDLQVGDAVFYADVSQPSDRLVPQYGAYRDLETGQRKPMIIVQAEWVDDEELIGFIDLHSGDYFVGPTVKG